ncbi:MULTISPECIES: hypothetical protein [unclassified Haladaptatus]|uniref:hypothetical protein n=1 Tax=unclassified Haladaptatus TaxID=2622732 RepID=UPI0023E801E0|nr:MULTISPECIES: hypothetical protein [unclassified Haladaptatus]
MMIDELDEIVEYATYRFGDSLRVVGYVTENERHSTVMRDDVAEQYDAAELDRIRDELVLSTIDHDHQENLYAMGTPQATVRVFEEAVLVAFDNPDENAAIIVSLDIDVDCSLVEFVTECRARFDGGGG